MKRVAILLMVCIGFIAAANDDENNPPIPDESNEDCPCYMLPDGSFLTEIHYPVSTTIVPCNMVLSIPDNDSIVSSLNIRVPVGSGYLFKCEYPSIENGNLGYWNMVIRCKRCHRQQTVKIAYHNIDDNAPDGFSNPMYTSPEGVTNPEKFPIPGRYTVSFYYKCQEIITPTSYICNHNDPDCGYPWGEHTEVAHGDEQESSLTYNVEAVGVDKLNANGDDYFYNDENDNYYVMMKMITTM